MNNLRNGIKHPQQIESLISENEALKVRVARLEDAIRYSTDYLDDYKLNSIGSGSKAPNELLEALNESPAQSLASIQADAVIEFLLNRPDKEIETDAPNWMIAFEDADVPNELIFDELTAHYVFEQRAISWNCHLFKRVDSKAGLEYAARTSNSAKEGE